MVEVEVCVTTLHRSVERARMTKRAGSGHDFKFLSFRREICIDYTRQRIHLMRSWIFYSGDTEFKSGTT